jgi:hypothetical protein
MRSIVARSEISRLDAQHKLPFIGTSSMGLAFALIPKAATFHNQTLWGAIGWPRRKVSYG